MRWAALLLALEAVAIAAFIAGYDAGWRTKREPDSAWRDREEPEFV